MKPAPSGAAPGASVTLEEELLRLLARQGRRVPLPIFLASCALAALFLGTVPTWLLAGWLILVAVVLAVRWAVLRRLPTEGRLTIARRLQVAAALAAVSGITHGLSLTFFPYLPPFERAIQSMLLISACAGSVATTAGYMPIFLAYLVPTLGSLIVIWLVNPGLANPTWVEYFASGMMMLLFAVFVSLARDAWRMFRESFEIRLHQSELNRQLEGALEVAESANRAKTRFLAAASHDLRQPTHTLSIFGAALSMRPLDEPSREIARHMNTAVHVLASQLDALLDISKLDAGVVRVNRAPLGLRGFLERLRDEIRPAALQKGLQVSLACAQDGMVDTDPMLLERILRNLLDNAVKYTASGSVRLEARRENGAFVISVADTGPGIPRAEQARVFEEFYQLDNPERDRTRGLGLGLAIVQRLAALLALRMEMTSSPGEGTHFRLVVPAALHRLQPQASPRPARPLASALHVLVVDDEAEIRLGMKTLLEGMGCRATLAEGTEQALAAARAARPDLMLVDLRLRDVDNGIATVRAVRALYPEVPALLISGDIASERLREAEEAGIALLHKPVPAETLKRAIAEAVAQ